MTLLLLMLKEVLTEFTFGIWKKNDAIRIINNSNLIDKKCVLYFFLLIYKKWVSAIPLKKPYYKKTEMWY